MSMLDSYNETVAVTRKTRNGDTVSGVEGRLVRPGLAVAPRLSDPQRFDLTHIQSGLAFLSNRCERHMAAALKLIGETTDWSRTGLSLASDPALKDLQNHVQGEIGYRCDRRCDLDPDAVSWEVRCSTCDWQWDDEDDYEGPLDAEEAKRLARDHECESYVEIKGPGLDRWHEEWRVNKDGTLYEFKKSGGS